MRSKIINRLEIIKNLIALEDQESISKQITILTEQSDKELNEIIVHLLQKSYVKAIKSIDNYINSNLALTVLIDPEIQALRFEAKSIECQIQDLSAEKIELEKIIFEFNVRHNNELGELILKILQFRKENAKGTIHEEDAEKDFQNYNKSYEIEKKKKVSTLTVQEQTEIKDKYRKASKLCHPDVVDEKRKSEAHKIFMDLNIAYETNDIKRVREIFNNLRQDNMFMSKSETITLRNTLENELARLHQVLQTLIQEICNIKESEIFINIINIENLDEYFNSTKQNLQQQIKQMENGKQ